MEDKGGTFIRWGCLGSGPKHHPTGEFVRGKQVKGSKRRSHLGKRQGKRWNFMRPG